MYAQQIYIYIYTLIYWGRCGGEVIAFALYATHTRTRVHMSWHALMCVCVSCGIYNKHIDDAAAHSGFSVCVCVLC